MKRIGLGFVFLFTSLTSQAAVLHTDLTSLINSTDNVIIEDWSSYEYHTVLSNTTTNNIIYPGQNSLGEDLVTWCTTPGQIGCLRYLVDDGRSRSFGRRSITFGFESPINAFSLYLFQNTNNLGPGTSIWDITFNTSEIFTLEVDYGVEGGPGYIGISELEDSSSITITQIRNDVNVVWSFGHLGFQTVQPVNAPIGWGLVMMGIFMLLNKKNGARAKVPCF